MGKQIKFPINLAFALALAIVALITWLSIHNTMAMIESDRWEDEAYREIQAFDRLIGALTDAETGQRGFIITGQERYLAPYQQAQNEINSQITALLSLTTDNPQQRKRLDAIQALVRVKLAELKETIALRRAQGFEAAHAVVMTGRGEANIEAIRKLVEEAQHEEGAILAERGKVKKADANGSMFTVIAGNLLSMALLMVVFRLLKKEIVQRLATENELVLHRDHLNEMVDERTRELGRANASLQLEIERHRAAQKSLEAEIEERKRAQQGLDQARNELEQRVEERTAELSHAVASLHEEVTQRSLAEQSLRERSDQLRLLASEVTLAEQRERQRLAQILHDGLQQILVAAKFRLALVGLGTDLRPATTAVADLIDDAIETSRSLTAEISPPILHQGGLVAALEWLVRWMREKHGLHVSLTTHQRIEPATEEITVMLFQAARELLFNVVKHAGVKSARVEVSCADGQLQVEVEDDGMGFDPSQIRAQGGTAGGIGLFSVRERLNLLGGHMEIDSAPGKGCRFKLVAPYPMPLKAAEIHASAEPQQAASRRPEATAAVAAERKIRVMLVDDHIVMRQGLAGLLRIVPDMEIVGEASDGASAVNLVREGKPDVVLMDISMETMDGIQATKIIRSEMPDVRVIGLSMFAEGDQEAAMREAGAVGYLAKSGPSEAVIAAIRSCVGREKPQAQKTQSAG